MKRNNIVPLCNWPSAKVACKFQSRATLGIVLNGEMIVFFSFSSRVNRLWTDRNDLDWTNTATKLLFKTRLCCICCLGLAPDHPKIYLVRTNKGWGGGLERSGWWHEKTPSKEKHTEICAVSETIRVLGGTKSSHEFE